MTDEPHHPLADCTRCPLYGNDTYVATSHGPGSVAIVGAYPGWQEVRAGVPMVGKSGKLLLQLVDRAEAGKLLADSTVTNAIACQPLDGQEKKLAKPIECCAGRLREEIKDAEQILALGREAGKAVTGTYTKMTDTPTVTADQWEGRRVVAGPNPAAVLRSPGYADQLQASIEKLSTPDVSVTWEWPPYETSQRVELDAWTFEKDGPPLVIDIEYTGDVKWDRFDVGRLRCLGIGDGEHIYVIDEQDLLKEHVRYHLTGLFARRGVVGHNVKGDLGILGRRGIGGRIAGDTMMAAVVLDERPIGRGLEALCSRYLGLPSWKPPGTSDQRGKWYATCSDEELHHYNAKDVAATQALMRYFQGRDAWDDKLHTDLLVPAVNMLRDVEDRGIGVDDSVLEPMIERYEIEEQVRRCAVIEQFGEISPNSSQQVLAAFREVGVAIENTTKETLRDLMDSEAQHPEVCKAAELLLRYRKVNKALSTYLRPLLNRPAKDRRVHADFNPAGTETGRLACARPNMQNWPRSDQPMLEGFGDVRSCFWAGEGRSFVKVDLSQAELRVIGVESGDEALLAICRDPDADLHTEVAEQIGRPRVQAKAINFGLPFGLSEYGLQRILGLSESDARGLVRDHKARFPGVHAWQAEIKRKTRAGEALSTVFGRMRRPLHLDLLDKYQAEQAEREMLAFTSQAVVSDITLLAAIEASKQGVAVVNLVHDEIRAECDEDDADNVAKILTECVRVAGRRYTDQVEFPVESKVSTHWT